MTDKLKLFREIEREVDRKEAMYHKFAYAIKELWDIVHNSNVGDKRISNNVLGVISYYQDTIFNDYRCFTTYMSSVGDIRLSYKLQGLEIENMHNDLESIYAYNLTNIQNIILYVLQKRYTFKTYLNPDCTLVVVDDKAIINFIIMLLPYTMFKHFVKENKIIIKRRTLKDDKYGNDDLCNTEMDKLAYKYIDSDTDAIEYHNLVEFMYHDPKEDEKPIVDQHEITNTIEDIKTYLDHNNTEAKSSGTFYAVTRLSTFDTVAEYFKNNSKYVLELVDTLEDEKGMVPIKITIDESSEYNKNADMINFLCEFVDNLFGNLAIDDLRILPLKYYTKEQQEFITNELEVDIITFKTDKDSEYKKGFMINWYKREKIIKMIGYTLESLGYSYKKIIEYFEDQFY